MSPAFPSLRHPWGVVDLPPQPVCSLPVRPSWSLALRARHAVGLLGVRGLCLGQSHPHPVSGGQVLQRLGAPPQVSALGNCGPLALWRRHVQWVALSGFFHRQHLWVRVTKETFWRWRRKHFMRRCRQMSSMTTLSNEIDVQKCVQTCTKTSSKFKYFTAPVFFCRRYFIFIMYQHWLARVLEYNHIPFSQRKWRQRRN